MSRILRRPMFRGGSTSREGIMSVPRKGYANSYLYGVGNEDSTNLDTTTGFENLFGDSDRASSLTYSTGLSQSDLETSKDEGTINRGILSKKLKEAEAADELGLSPMGKRFRDRYLSQRGDPMGKFLINFGLNYMSARPRGGKFGALTTAAEAAKKPTEQLYADQDTEAALELKLLSAFGKEKDTDLTRLAKAWAERPENKGKTEQDFFGELAKQKLENKDLRDLSDRALVRKFGEDWGKKQKIDDPVQQQNVGIFRLRFEKKELPKDLVDSLAPNKIYIDLDEVKPKQGNPDMLEIKSRPEEYSTTYKYINPFNRGIYGVQEQSGKKFLYKIGQYN
jgi:hypothetical protein